MEESLIAFEQSDQSLLQISSMLVGILMLGLPVGIVSRTAPVTSSAVLGMSVMARETSVDVELTGKLSKCERLF